MTDYTKEELNELLKQEFSKLEKAYGNIDNIIDTAYKLGHVSRAFYRKADKLWVSIGKGFVLAAKRFSIPTPVSMIEGDKDDGLN